MAFCNLIKSSEATGFVSWCSFAQVCPIVTFCPTVTSNSMPTAARISSDALIRPAPRAAQTEPQANASISSTRPTRVMFGEGYQQ